MRWRLVLACMILLAFMISMTSGAGQNNDPSANVTSTNFINIPSGSLVLMGILILLLLLFASVPILLNMYWSYKYLDKGQALLKDMIEKSQGNSIDKDLIQAAKDSFKAQPIGIQGIGRSTMALSLVVIVGIGVFYVMLYPLDIDKSAVVKDILLTLAGAISSIVGFYFGGRAGQAGDGSASTATPSATPSAMPAQAMPAQPHALEVNLPPVMNSLTPESPSPQPAGTTINLTANATDPENDPLSYKFLLRGPSTNDQLVEKTDWIADNTWAWITFPDNTGTYQIEARVRDGKHAGPESYDDKKMVEYTLTAAASSVTREALERQN